MSVTADWLGQNNTPRKEKMADMNTISVFACNFLQRADFLNVM